MKLAHYEFNGQRLVGSVSPDGQEVRALEPASGVAERGVLAYLESRVDWDVFKPAGPATPLSSVTLLSPLPRPRRNLFCVGRNYHAHAKELSGSVFKSSTPGAGEWPIVFTKVPECVTGPFSEVVLPGHLSSQIDYEAELAVVIGQGGRDIDPANAMDHIFGYTIVNDVTARDVQMRHQQWDLGKSFDTFCPMGPWIVTADELDATDTRVRCWVNDELRQDGATRDLIFDIPTLIATCSRGITLYPGDVIATGTPAGVGMGLQPPRFLADGDVVRISIDGIGQIENKFVAQKFPGAATT